jgi:hypothetical protein
MAGKMNNIALNSDVVEQLENTYNKLEFKEPDIDIKEEMSDYVESLEVEEDHDRESKLKSWVENKISHLLEIWEGKYESGSELLKTANTEIANLVTLKEKEQNNINNIQSKIADKESDKDIKQKQIDIAKQDMIGSTKIDLKSEKRTVKILIFISILLSVGTYLYFMQAQTEIKWSTISKSEKVAQVKDMILNGASNQYSAFYEYIATDDNDNIIPLDNIKMSDLGGINTKNVQIAPKPTLGQSISVATLAFAFISFLFVMLGKVTALAYRKLGYPRWMFMLTWIAAALVMFGGTYIMSSLGEKQIIKVNLTDSIQDLKEKVIKIKLSNESAFGGGYEDDTTQKVEDPEISKLEAEIAEKQKSLDAVIVSIGDFKFWMMTLFFIAEIIFGSIAWMSYEEYIQKKLLIAHSGQDVVDQLEIELSKIKTDIETQEQDAAERQRRIAEATNLESRLISLKAKLYSKNTIHNIAEGYKKSKIAEGQTMLQRAKLNWSRG